MKAFIICRIIAFKDESSHVLSDDDDDDVDDVIDMNVAISFQVIVHVDHRVVKENAYFFLVISFLISILISTLISTLISFLILIAFLWVEREKKAMKNESVELMMMNLKLVEVLRPRLMTLKTMKWMMMVEEKMSLGNDDCL